MEFSRQEYWSGFLFPAPWDLPDPGIEPTFLASACGLFTTEPPRKGFSNRLEDTKEALWLSW